MSENNNNRMTTIAVEQSDKDLARRYAAPIKNMRSGTKYETDSQIYHKMLKFYAEHHQPLSEVPRSTYPPRPKDPTAVVVQVI